MRTLLAVAAGIVTLGAGLWITASPAGAMAPSAEAGAEIAARWCAACHVISENGAGTDAAPSFVAIAHHRKANELRSFLEHTHAKPMRGFTLSGHEIDDLVAYIVTLDNGVSEQKAQH